MKLTLRHLILHYQEQPEKESADLRGQSCQVGRLRGEDHVEGEQTGWRWMVYCSAGLELERKGEGQ